MTDGIRIEQITVDSPLYEGERQLRYDILLSVVGLPKYSFEHLDASSYHFVAVDNSNTVVGCVLFHSPNERRKIGRLFQMAIASSLQKQGIGKKLVKALEATLIKDGFFTITCHARTSAIPFYEKMGFSCFAHPFEEVGIPHRYMRKTIRPIRAIAFDCGGVLAHDVDYSYLMKKTPEDKHSAVKAAITQEWDKMKVDVSYTTEQFWKSVLAASGIDPSSETIADFEQHVKLGHRPFWGTFAIVDRVLQKYGHKAHQLQRIESGLHHVKHQLIPQPAGACENESTQKSRMFVGIISNYNQTWFHDVSVKFDFAQLFPDPSLVVVSCDAKSAKPEASILQFFLTNLNTALAKSGSNEMPIRKEEVILIDDKLRNVTAAQEFGFQAIQYNATHHPSGVLVNLLGEYGIDVTEPGVLPPF